ncbi:MAG: signal peptidase [Patescibacteria group bacterium]|nr:signal peptidase [Patescibacteria group bacterium]
MNNDSGEKYQAVGLFIWEVIKIVALAFIIIVPIRVFLFQPFFVQGASMETSFEDGQYLIINELGYKQTSLGFDSKLLTIKPFKKMERQTVVVFRYPLDPEKFFIKRIIGLPGEKVEIKNSQITIYNQENPEGFALDETGYLFKSVKTNPDMAVSLKDDEYFVMGDNRTASSDSRVWGPVPQADIMGKVLIRAWPLDKIDVY